MIKKLFLCLSLFAIVGCATTGNASLKDATEQSVEAKIVEGKTTKAEVQSIFGSPITSSYTDSGLLIWKYNFDKTKPKAINFVPYVNLFKAGAIGERKELTVLFDQNDIVKKYNMSVSAIDTNTGIFAQ